MQTSEQLELVTYYQHMINTTEIPKPTANYIRYHILLSGVEPSEISMDTETAVKKIITEVCLVVGIPVYQLLTNRSRKRKYTFARNLIIHFATKLTDVSLKRLAFYMWQGEGKPKDHSTIIHSRNKCQDDINNKCQHLDFYQNYTILEARMQNQFAQWSR